MKREAANNFRLMVAGGGTGGHLFPGVAIAEEFLRRSQRSEILFVGTGRPLEARVLDPRGFKRCSIPAAGFKGKKLTGRLRSLFTLPRGIVKSLILIRDFKPDLVIGVGGYVSGPVVLAAWMLGLPTAIQEQNSVPGMSNRLLGRVAGLIFISFEQSRGFFPRKRTYLTGNPIRGDLSAVAAEKHDDDGEVVVLVVGGSQGASALNEAVVGAVRILVREGSLQGPPRIRFVHQTGPVDCEAVQAAYQRISAPAQARAFIDNMDEVYRGSDLVIARGGALTVTETAVMGLPAIFIPLPSAAGNHQEFNARSVADQGAAEVILQKDLTPGLLADRILRLALDPDRRREMSAAARRTARPAAVREICDLCAERFEKVGRRLAA